MLSNNLLIIRKHNCFIKRNKFNLINNYTDFCDSNNYIIAYLSYLKDINEKDRLIYSKRIEKSMITTWYNYESTFICDISNNKLINNKELITHNNISHNLSLFNDDNNIIGYGGVYSHQTCSNNKSGLFSFNFKNDNIYNIKITIPKSISLKCNFSTAFDSNISCLKFNKKYYIYTRYNQSVGIRRTQLFISDKFDSEFKSISLVKFNDPTVFTYMQNIYIENNIFIGIFRIYRKKNIKNQHDLYNSDTKISYIIAHSFDGINFIIDSENFIPNIEIWDILSTNYKKSKNKKSFFTSSVRSPPNNTNIIKEYEIRDGGYINYQTEKDNVQGEINLQVLENKNTILLNYTINDGGYINIFFIDENQNEISKKELIITDHVNNIINLPNNCKFINIKFKKSNLYQIL